jgi:hypothetical protein
MGQLVRGAPGLYLRGMPSEPVLQLTAVTGFVGITERGPVHRPEPIRNWDEYLTVFGQPVDHAFLPNAVFGFFRNGGGKCFVVRVADMTDLASQNVSGRCPRLDLLLPARTVAPINDSNGNETIRIEAIDSGRWGNAIRYDIRVGTQRHMPLTMLTASAAAGATTIAVADPFDVQPDTDIRLAPPGDPFGGILAQVQSVDGAARTVTLKAALAAPLVRSTLVLGQGFKLIVRCGDRIEVFDNLSMSQTNARYVVAVVNGPDNTLPYIARQEQGHSILVRISQVFGAGSQSRFRPVAPTAGNDVLVGGGDGFRYAAATLKDAGNQNSITVLARAAPDNAQTLGNKGNAIRVRAAGFATRLALEAAAATDTIVLENSDGLVVGDSLILADPANPALTETRAVAGIVAGSNQVRLTGALANTYPLGASARVAGRFVLSVFQGPGLEPAEVHRNLSANPVSPRYFRGVLGNNSVLLCGDGPDVLLQPPVGEAQLAGGRDPGSIDYRWYTGYDGAQLFVPPGAPAGRRYGLATLEGEEEIDLVAMPDLVGQALLPQDEVNTPATLYLQSYRQVLYHAAKCGDRLALIDPLPDTPPEAAAAVPQQLSDPLTAKFGAFYYPWLKIANGEAERLVPPSGFVAGIMARADQEGGVARAPANYPLLDVVDLEVLLEQADQDNLNPAGINCARKLEKPTIELWGARTLSSDPAARYVNVRRLVMAVKKALARTLTWTVFEPNGPLLWRRIQASLQALMQTLVLGGATAAASGEDSFFVKCDAETNPPEAADAGQVIANVGIALAAPAEFILLNVKRTPDSVSVSEQGG